MEPRKALLSGTASLIVGAIGMAALAAAGFVPAPWNVVVGLVGLLGAGLAGLAAPPFKFAASAPKVQGSVFAVAGMLGGVIEQTWAMIPPTFQPIALTVAGLLAWLTGRAMPALGTQAPSTELELPAGPPVKNATEAASVFNKVP